MRCDAKEGPKGNREGQARGDGGSGALGSDLPPRESKQRTKGVGPRALGRDARVSVSSTASEGSRGRRHGEGTHRRRQGSTMCMETFSGSCWGTVLDRMARSQAEVLFAQETKLKGEEEQEEAAR